ncbi:zinc finger MYM-type protein 1-like protein [Tanacetum coccineum]
MNASERVSKVCALECNFLSPTLKVRDFQARLASLGLQKTISELRSITTPVKTQKKKRNGLKLAFVLDTEFAPATFGPYESCLKEGPAHSGSGAQPSHQYHCLRMSRHVKFYKVWSNSLHFENITLLRKTETFGNRNILKSSSFTYGCVILESDFSHADAHLNALADYMTLVIPYHTDINERSTDIGSILATPQQEDMDISSVESPRALAIGVFSVAGKKSKMYPLIDRLIRLILTLHVSTTTFERAFSNMKLMKTRLRSTMGDDFLKSSMILSIEREIVGTLCNEKIIDDFYSKSQRRVQIMKKRKVTND